MQDISQETHHETTRLTQSAQVVLWEIDLTVVGGERYFFCNEQNDKGDLRKMVVAGQYAAC